MSAELARALEKRLTQVTGRPSNVSHLAPVTGGASRQTWSFDLIAEDVLTPLILRRDPLEDEEPARMAREQAALAEAARVGVSVPIVIDGSAGRGAEDLDTTGLGRSYMILTRLSGEALPNRLLRDDKYSDIRSRLPYELGVTLARIHQMDPSKLELEPEVDPVESLFKTYVDGGEPLPALEIAFRWLRQNRPMPSRSGVVHGDFRMGNLMITPDRLEGVLDWELVHLGDPMEDLGWLCTRAWRFGSPWPVGGLGSREELLRGYGDENGTVPDADTVHWWEVYGSLRWALICRTQAMRADSDFDNRLELLAIGRRVAECEYDLLDALGTTPAKHVVSTPAADFAEPGADALLTAVAEFVDEIVAGSDPQTRYRGRVAKHVLGVVRRSFAAQQDGINDVQRAISNLGFATEQGLALAIRAGQVDASEAAISEAIRQAVAVRVGVANPKYW